MEAIGSEQTTDGICVKVTPAFQPQHSHPEQNQYFWTYTITISNQSARTVQLRSRHWIITDGNGHVEEVRGEGVVGQQPVLEPGEEFIYTSGCPLQTPTGSMRGTYSMIDPDGDEFTVAIAPFLLESEIVFH